MSRDRNVVKQFFKSMSSELSGVEFFGYLGNREGVVKADNLNNVWVLLFNGSVVKARNKVAPLVSRTPVAVGYTKEDPKLLQVLRVMNVYDRNTQPYLPPHAKSHSWPGADTVSIRAEQIVPGLALPSGGMVVKYYGWPYEIDGAWYYIRSREFDLTSYIPDTGAVWVSVEVDDAGDVTYVESDPADSKDLLTFAMLPVVPETRVMLFAVKCYTGQTEVVKTELDNDIFDPRLALHARKAAAVWGEITGDIEDQTDLVEYIDDRMTGLWDDRGNYDASGNAYPSSGGSGTAGAILKGDIWTISVAGTLPTGRVVEIGDTVRALVDSPGSTEANWAIGQNNIGYVAENSANKTDAMAGNTASSTKYLSAKGVYDWAVATFQAALTAAGLGDFIVALTGKTTPVDADTIILSDSAASDDAKKVTWANIKATLKTYFDTLYQAVGSYLNSDGWISVPQTFTAASSDDPVYQIYVSGDVTSNANYKLGNKIAVTISGADRYGFIVKIGAYDGGNNRTPVDIYGGSDYDITGTMTNPRISKVKSPDGFPLSEEKWTQTLTDTTFRAQNSPTNGSYYTPGSLSISCPIGVWRGSLSCMLGARGTNTIYALVGLSTSTSSITETEISSSVYTYVSTASVTVENMLSVFKTKLFSFTSKTTLNVVLKAATTGMTQIYLSNADAPLTVKLVCAYL